jgi:transposase
MNGQENRGVIEVGQLAKIRRLHLREGMPIKEISRTLGLSRNTVKRWLRSADMKVPAYPKRSSPSKLDAYKEVLTGWLKLNAHRNKRERKSITTMTEALRSQGYGGSYSQVARFVRRFKAELGDPSRRAAFVPLKFPQGDAAQFDWSTEYVWIGGLRRRVSAAHMKLCCSRAFVISAYPSEAHEMLFDAHNRAFQAFGGVPSRVIYDNMKTAVDRVLVGKLRAVNARFEVLCGHYLFEPEFCTVAAGWEKGIVEKNVQDARRRIWVEVCERCWEHWGQLNDWLLERCRLYWQESLHPEWPELTIAEVLQDEARKLMATPKPFDGYIELLLRVSPTGLIHIHRNRYSVPIRLAHQMVSAHLYPHRIDVVADGERVAEHVRSFDRYLTVYDWRHYIEIVQIKPGSLRNGAPFATMPEPFKVLQRHLMQHAGGDRVMAGVLAAVSLHGLEAVLVAVELALESGRVSGEHVSNVLARLASPSTMIVDHAEAHGETMAKLDGPPRGAMITLVHEPRANTQRYELLMGHGGAHKVVQEQEPHHVQ